LRPPDPPCHTMDAQLNIKGLFRDEQEFAEVIRLRKVCYETEPYYIPDRKGSLLQIGFQLNLYGTFTDEQHGTTPDSAGYRKAVDDIKNIAEALSNTCNPEHMCESTIVEAGALTYSKERGMRPDVTVHIPIFDQANFGHPVDEKITKTLHAAEKLLEAAGIQKGRWHD